MADGLKSVVLCALGWLAQASNAVEVHTKDGYTEIFLHWYHLDISSVQNALCTQADNEVVSLVACLVTDMAPCARAARGGRFCRARRGAEAARPPALSSRPSCRGSTLRPSLNRGRPSAGSPRRTDGLTAAAAAQRAERSEVRRRRLGWRGGTSARCRRHPEQQSVKIKAAVKGSQKTPYTARQTPGSPWKKMFSGGGGRRRVASPAARQPPDAARYTRLPAIQLRTASRYTRTAAGTTNRTVANGRMRAHECTK